ncbi:MAG: rubredoxin, partial [Candidatus Hydrothermarchaeota archaeon]|nr:rubredoxin [Candidatus Hydrothermarchaeota archaeon]
MRFRCTVCNWVYDEGKEGKNFADLPASYACPVCGALKNVFIPEEKVETEVSTTVAD